ncbi:MAG TPA: uracil-DNA glycosylase [Trinickia sp.]|uniref:uracil-DNA glycosylase n=1 Tax=Trinickia sp. TaxID=2571163 RepID=UPI002C2ED067|nr:uracil-DNA glycosylase [Trinickia sp.]HVW49126.1 uracil-DNA glycosylase [Trinickia sp.]
MALDEAALDTLGLTTLWVRRGAPAGRGERSAESVPSPRQGAAQVEDTPPQVMASLAQETPAARAPQGEETPPASVPQGEATAHAVSMPREESGVAMLDWDALEARVSACEQCRLCEKRTRTVFGVGDRAADWMLIGEAPGENEDKQGEPFVGQAGKLLDSMLRAVSLARGENVYIANVVKCRPPGNRNPEPDEVARCEPYLQRQVALVKPKLIVALGRVAAQNLLKTDASISSLRGRVHRYEDVPVIVTYHPAYLLRSLPDKAKAWLDLCLASDTYRQALDEQRAAR